MLTRLLGRHVALGERAGARPSGWRRSNRRWARRDVLGLAVETADMEGVARWLVDVVRTVARSSPSLALVLAARYTAHRAIRAVVGDPPRRRGDRGGRRRARPRHGARAVRPRGHGAPRRRRRGRGGHRRGGHLGRSGTPTHRPGGRAIARRSASLGEPSARLDRDAAPRRSTTGAADGGGRAGGGGGGARGVGRLRRTAAPVRVGPLSFAGMRAILAEMQLRVSNVAALLEQALDTGDRPRAFWRSRRPRAARRSTSRSTRSRCTAGTATSTSTRWRGCCGMR